MVIQFWCRWFIYRLSETTSLSNDMPLYASLGKDTGSLRSQALFRGIFTGRVNTSTTVPYSQLLYPLRRDDPLIVNPTVPALRPS
jgi:hypothetical protein